LYVLWLARDGAPQLFHGLSGRAVLPVVILAGLCAAGALTALKLRFFGFARIAAAAQVSLVLLGWGMAQYPYLIVPDITIYGSAAPAATLRLLLLALAVGGLLLFPSLAYLFSVFKCQRK
jgi:cytochrome d ubiquinol oxidase subunit II